MYDGREEKKAAEAHNRSDMFYVNVHKSKQTEQQNVHFRLQRMGEYRRINALGLDTKNFNMQRNERQSQWNPFLFFRLLKLPFVECASVCLFSFSFFFFLSFSCVCVFFWGKIYTILDSLCKFEKKTK